MNEASDDRLSVGIKWLLVYQGLIFLASLYLTVLYGYALVRGWPSSASREIPLVVLFILLLVGWGMAVAYASVVMARRRARGLLVGMICHLLLGILALVLLMVYGSVGVLGCLSKDYPGNEAKTWAPLLLFFGLMWLPFVLISGWGFFYLRRLRKSLLSWRVDRRVAFWNTLCALPLSPRRRRGWEGVCRHQRQAVR
jgi:hypothetical protein